MDKNKHIKIRGKRRAQPNIRRLSQAMLALAQAEAEREAQRHHEASTKDAKTPPSPEAGS